MSVSLKVSLLQFVAADSTADSLWIYAFYISGDCAVLKDGLRKTQTDRHERRLPSYLKCKWLCWDWLRLHC